MVEDRIAIGDDASDEFRTFVHSEVFGSGPASDLPECEVDPAFDEAKQLDLESSEEHGKMGAFGKWVLTFEVAAHESEH